MKLILVVPFLFTGFAGCSSSQNLGSTGLDGQWTITFTASDNDYSGGTMTVNGGVTTLQLQLGFVGVAGCTAGHDDLGLTVSGDGSMVAVNLTRVLQGASCYDPGSTPEGSLTATRTGTSGSSFGVLGGTWNLVVQEPGSSPDTCTMTVEGSTIVGMCQQAGSFSGSLQGNIFSGSAPGYEFAAQRN